MCMLLYHIIITSFSINCQVGDVFENIVIFKTKLEGRSNFIKLLDII